MLAFVFIAVMDINILQNDSTFEICYISLILEILLSHFISDVMVWLLKEIVTTVINRFNGSENSCQLLTASVA